MTQDDRPTCEDCGLRSDLGNKCRACYAKWSRALWSDIPMEQERLAIVSRALNVMAQPERKAIANAALGGKSAGVNQELLKRLQKVLKGPFGPQLESCLQAIWNAPEETGAKASRRGME